MPVFLKGKATKASIFFVNYHLKTQGEANGN